MSQIDDVVIKPCPFCGGNNISVDDAVMNSDHDGKGITCLVDGCMGNIFKHDSYFATRNDAINAWNKRAFN